MYRVFDKDSVVEIDERKENCILWQKLTSENISLKDIEQVVYKYSLAQMKDMMSVNDPNEFATWIRVNNDHEIHEMLTLAKKCEYSRGLMNDPWYYPSKNDGTYMSLIEIEESAKAYNGTRLRDRYALQAVRAMFSAKQYQKCIDYWSDIEGSLADGLIKEMIDAYIVGAYSRTGQTDFALQYFTTKQDLNSIIYCLRKQGKIKDSVEELEYITQYTPDSEQIPAILQEMISSMEPLGSYEVTYRYRKDTTMVNEYDREFFDRIYDVSTRMADNNSSANKAVWCYTAAFLADLNAEEEKAWDYILQAEKYQTSNYMKESIRVMKIYLDAKVSTYDSAYEARLLNDLKWLDGKIKADMDDSIKEKIEDMYVYRSEYYNFSFYYWNDVLRRILLAEVCPRMIDRRMYVRALQLANMADNHLLNLNNSIHDKTLNEYRSSAAYNHIDYCSSFFCMMYDSVPVEELISYIANTQHAKTQFDTFLNQRGYIDSDYFYDIAGTRYIKDRDYAKAVKYLALVTPSYQSRLNTSFYMSRDPFSIDRATLQNSENYKLNFATEMQRLKESIENATDNSKKALLMIRYAIGMKNSYLYCWTLTDYKRMVWHDNSSEYAPILLEVESMCQEALGMLDNDELAAAAHIQLCQWKTAVEKFPETYPAKYVKMVCDNLCDYNMKWVTRNEYN